MRWFAALLVGLLAPGCDDPSWRNSRSCPPSRTSASGPARCRRTRWSGARRPEQAPPLTLALIQRGQHRFRSFCTPCHSELGDGNGMIVQRGFSPPPSYHIARLREAPTRHFYEVITHGYGAMYAFDYRVPPDDRWAIAAYIRALQRSTAGKLDDLSPEQRAALAAAGEPMSRGMRSCSRSALSAGVALAVVSWLLAPALFPLGWLAALFARWAGRSAAWRCCWCMR